MSGPIKLDFLPQPPEPERIKENVKKSVAASLWKRFELDWKLENHQLKAYQLIKEAAKIPNSRYVLNASRRWGKTFLLCVLAIEFALANPGSMILYAGSTQKAIKDFIVPTFNEIFKDCPDKLRGILKTQLNQFVFSNGSKIKLTGLDGGRLQKLRGITAHQIIVDEAGFIDDLTTAVNSVLFPMTSTTGGQMILASNAPMKPGHDFIKVFARQAQVENCYLLQTIFDTSTFTKDQIDKWAAMSGGYDSATFQREYMCKHVIDEENSVIPEWGRHKEAIIKDEYELRRPEFFFPLVSIDLGLIDFTGVLFGYWNFIKGCGVIEDELLLKGTNSAKLVKACREKELQLWGDSPLKPPVRVADGQAFTINDIVQVHHYPVAHVSKDTVEAQANAIRLDVQSGRLIINPRCKYLIGQIEDVTWNKQRTEFTRDSQHGHYDLVAALQYFVRHLNRHSNPFPPHFQLDTRNMIIKSSRLNNPSLEAMKKLWGIKN